MYIYQLIQLKNNRKVDVRSIGINDNTKFWITIRTSITDLAVAFDSNAYVYLLKLQKYIMHKNYRASSISPSYDYETDKKKNISHIQIAFCLKDTCRCHIIVQSF